MTVTFDRSIYFDKVRHDPFPGKLSQQQVDGQNAILSTWEKQSDLTDLRWLAYMLATAYHETAYTMWPIEEYGKGQGHDYGKTDPETGQAYYGRGLVQLTWRENYARADAKMGWKNEASCEWHAYLQLTPDYATPTMFRGMSEGWFTGKKLSQYFNESKNDPVNARVIINNDVSKMGQKIAGYHEDFLAALKASSKDTAPPEAVGPVPQMLHDITLPVGVQLIITVDGLEVGRWLKEA